MSIQRTLGHKVSNECVYAVWFNKIYGNLATGRKMLEKFGSYKDAWYNITKSDEPRQYLTDAAYKRFERHTIIESDILYQIYTEDIGHKVVTADSPLYPKELKTILDYPHVLFCIGNVELLQNPAKIAIVGSRKPTEKAYKTAYNAAYNLAKTGAVIVSGGADGIDKAAHRGALDARGETIAVFAGGLLSISSGETQKLFDEIVENNGLVITEYFHDTISIPQNFPIRNRIISGISSAVLVACASAGKSGSRITAELAVKQKKPLFALAPEICYSEGCEELIKEGKANVFYHAGDIAYPIRHLYPEGTFNENYCSRAITVADSDIIYESNVLPKKQKNETKETGKINETKEKKTDSSVMKIKKGSQPKNEKPTKTADEPKKPNPMLALLGDTAKKIYEILPDTPVHPDEIVKKSNINPSEVFAAVSELVIFGAAKDVSGGRIQKI